MVKAKNFYKSALCAAVAAGIGVFALQAQADPLKTKNPDLQQAALRYDIQAPRKLDLKYDVYAGGFHALNAQLEMDLDKKAYDMSLDATTEGFIGKIFPWKASMETSGHAEKGKLMPTVSTSRSSWRDKVNTTELSYDRHGNLLKATTHEGAKTTVDRDIDKKMSADAVDILTGALLMLQNTKNTDKCKGSFPVFDGHRRFNITLKDNGTETLDKSRYSSFSGKALRCTLTVQPVAGFKPKDQKRGWLAVQNHTAKRHKLPTIWLAQIDEKSPVVPVRMEISSEYGSVVAHLSQSKKD
ncbi:MAG: DUF3108 domain-containing protein [Alphaproteobacteria bacterium]|nr:DUF3108 domain-containing protein [Alphaproteobacteria bacterium]